MVSHDKTPTPRGLFTVQWKAQKYTSREFQVEMPWSVFFADGGIVLHQGNVDHPSAGCVKLHEDDARAFSTSCRSVTPSRSSDRRFYDR